MDFQQAERKFKELKASYEAGELSEAEFKTQLEGLMVQDEAGSWWMIGFETELWYRHDGTEWVQADPPGSVSQKPLTAIEAEEEIVHEITEREDGEKAAKEKVEPEAFEGARKISSYPRPAAKHDTGIEPPKSKSRNWMVYAVIGFVGIALCCVSGIWMYNRLISPPAATEAPAPEELAEEEPAAPVEEPAEEEPESTEAPAPEESTGELGVGSTMISEKDGMVMVYVPAGEFQMGNEIGDSNEKPVHTVYLDAFWIDQTEVTNEMFAAFLNVKGNQSEGGATWLGLESDEVPVQKVENIWQVDLGYEDHPVVNVTWYGARAYCEWAYRRLPTEAEWEKAARGGLEGKLFPWGNSDPVCDPGAYNGAQSAGCADDTVPVGSFGKNGFGLYDMAGNVWEWVSSLYRPYPYDATDGRESLSSSGYRVSRGGSWNNWGLILGGRLSTSSREWSSAKTFHRNIGFRCARDAVTP